MNNIYERGSGPKASPINNNGMASHQIILTALVEMATIEHQRGAGKLANEDIIEMPNNLSDEDDVQKPLI